MDAPSIPTKLSVTLMETVNVSRALVTRLRPNGLITLCPPSTTILVAMPLNTSKCVQTTLLLVKQLPAAILLVANIHRTMPVAKPDTPLVLSCSAFTLLDVK